KLVLTPDNRSYAQRGWYNNALCAVGIVFQGIRTAPQNGNSSKTPKALLASGFGRPRLFADDVLFQSMQLVAILFHHLLQQVPNGKDSAQPAPGIDDRQMAEMMFEHRGQSLGGSNFRVNGYRRGGHQLGDRNRLGITAAQRQLSQHIALGEDAQYLLGFHEHDVA